MREKKRKGSGENCANLDGGENDSLVLWIDGCGMEMFECISFSPCEKDDQGALDEQRKEDE